MSTQEILAELPLLSSEERERIAAALQDLAAGASPAPAATLQPRRPDLHAGAGYEIADDFDAPLPDSFWLGSDA